MTFTMLTSKIISCDLSFFTGEDDVTEERADIAGNTPNNGELHTQTEKAAASDIKQDGLKTQSEEYRHMIRRYWRKEHV